MNNSQSALIFVQCKAWSSPKYTNKGRLKGETHTINIAILVITVLYPQSYNYVDIHYFFHIEWSETLILLRVLTYKNDAGLYPL